MAETHNEFIVWRRVRVAWDPRGQKGRQLSFEGTKEGTRLGDQVHDLYGR